jgi:DNA-directed RNA polymerase specialized sigma24 family protein
MSVMRNHEQPVLIDYLLQHRDEILAHLTRRLGSAAVAEDAVRETVVLVRSQSLPATISNPRAYLFRIATHLGIDRLLRECAQSTLCHQLNTKRWDGPTAG